MMKSITGYWSKCDRAGEVVRVIIKDESAIEACNRNGETGWTIRETVNSFNRFLQAFGFKISHIEHWNGDEYE